MFLQIFSRSFKYKSSFFKSLTADDNGVFKKVKIVVTLKHLSNFWRSLEMPLINCKTHLALNWNKDCVMPTIANTKLEITNAKLYVPIVALSSKDNEKLVKLLEDGFNRHVYWSKYQTKIETRNLDNNTLTRYPLDASFQGVRRLFVLAFDNTDDGAKNVKRNSHTKYYLPRVNITNYNVLIDRRNFHDQPINDMRKKNTKKLKRLQQDNGMITQQDVLLDYQYFKDNHNFIAIDLSRQKEF